MPINSNYGEKDWGFCLDPGNKNILYNITVKTDILSGTGGTSGQIQIKLIGDMASPWSLFSESGFQTSKADLALALPIVGDIKMIVIYNNGSSPWLCQSIVFVKVIFQYNFNCKGPILPKSMEYLGVHGFKTYKLKIMKSSNMACNDALSLKLNGVKGSAPPVMIAGHGIFDHEYKYDFMSNDVGTLASLVLIKKKNGITCNLKYLEISYYDDAKSKEVIKSFDISSTTIIESLNLKIAILNSEVPLRFNEDDYIPLKEQAYGFPIEETPIYENLKVRDVDQAKADSMFNGQGCMAPVDSRDIVDLSCDTTLYEILYLFKVYNIHAEKANLFPNTEFVIGKCPSDCVTFGTKTIGIDVHPLVSSICVAAVVDRVSSIYGGLIGITLAPGLKMYENGRGLVYNGIKVAKGGEYPLSFTLSKIDNPDMVYLNARIMNSAGQPDSFGRPELRIDESFHAICGEGPNMNKVAAMACREAGYNYGYQYLPGATFLDPEDTNCATYCGSPFLNRLGFTCPNSATVLAECDRVFIENCGGNKDLVVMCSDTELSNNEPNFKRAFEPAGKNRYYPAFWYDDNKTYPCEGAVGATEASLLCEAVGHEKGGWVATASKDDIPCSPDGGSKSALQVKCPFDAAAWGKACRVQQSGKPCAAFAVIQCRDPKSFMPAYKAALVPPGRLPYPQMMEVTCSDSAMELYGDPGSTYLVLCPANCDKEGALIEGTGVFSSDTSLCVAAIHSGAMFASESTIVQITLGYPTFKLKSTIGHGVTSLEGEKKFKSFKVSKPASCSLYMAKLYETLKKEASFIQIRGYTQLINRNNKYNNLSFTQEKTIIRNEFKNKTFNKFSNKSKLRIRSKFKFYTTNKTKHNLPVAHIGDLEQYRNLEVKNIKKLAAYSYFDGTGCLSKKEQLNIVPVTCSDSIFQYMSQLGIPDIEFEKVNIWPNYGSMLIRCPAKCGGIGAMTSGINIHPWDAPLCVSAVVDKSVSVYGGIARVTLAPGLDYYENGTGQILNVKVQRHAESRLSYTTAPVDNVDYAKMNVRFMDATNNPNSYGRVEIRWFDAWHSLCGKGDNAKNARMLCMAGGYLGGFQLYPMKSPDDPTNSGCGPYCGDDSVNRVQFVCGPDATFVDDCDVVNFVVCDSFNDLVVKCVDFEVGPDEPDFKRDAIKVGKNRYVPQFWYGGKKALPCLKSMKDNEAKQYCKAEGYSGGGMVVPKKPDEAIPSSDEKTHKFASELACPSTERFFGGKCAIRALPIGKSCDDMYETIECFGDKSASEDYIAPYVPVLRMPFSEAVLAGCETDATELMGDPGSKYLVRCPTFCQESASKMEGSGVYGLDTSICRAAIHSGVAFPGVERAVNVTIGWPMKKVYPTDSHKVQSYSGEQVFKTFKVSETDSCTMYQTELMKEYLKDFFIQTSMKLKSRKLSEKLKWRSSIKSQTRVAVRNEESGGLIKEWRSANFRTFAREYSPLFHYIRMGEDIVNLDGTKYLSMMEDPNAWVMNRNFPMMFTLAWGMKLPYCPFEEDMCIMTNGENGFYLVIRKSHGMNKCKIVIKNYLNPLSEYVFDTEFRPYQSFEFVNYAFTYKQGEMVFWAKGEPVAFKNNLRFHEFGKGDAPLHIGADSSSKGWKLNGAVNYVLFFSEAVDRELLQKLDLEGVTEYPSPASSTGQYTLDGRSCISDCRSGHPRIHTSLDLDDDANQKLNDLNNIFKRKNKQGLGELLTRIEDDQIDEEDERADHDKGQAQKLNQSIQAICQMTYLQLISTYPIKEGQNTTVKCPPSCSQFSNNVFGPSESYNPDVPVYASESSMCAAASHSGIIQITEGGDIDVFHRGMQKDFKSFAKNNITSKAIQRSVGFSIQKVVKVYNLDKSQNLHKIYNNQNQIHINCPSGMYKSYKEETLSNTDLKLIYGSQLFSGRGYSQFSRICYAGLHSGILGNANDSKIVVDIYRLPYKVNFTCQSGKDCEVNGVKSHTVIDDVGFTIRSNSQSCGYTVVKFFPNQYPKDYFTMINKGIRAIYAVENIINEENYALRASQIPYDMTIKSYLLFKNFECATYEYNIAFRTSSKHLDGGIVALLNYHEIDNEMFYYSVRVEYNKMHFIIKRNQETILASKSIKPLRIYTMYRIKAIVKYGNIKVFISYVPNVVPILMFDINNNEYQRGMAGFAYYHTKNVYVYEVEVSPTSDKMIKTNPSDIFCTSPRDKMVRKRMCITHQCLIPSSTLYYCKLCCNRLIHINDQYGCQKDCIRNNKLKDNN